MGWGEEFWRLRGSYLPELGEVVAWGLDWIGLISG